MKKCAITFAGQGSQSVGMMAGFSDLPIVKKTFDEASDKLGQDMWALVNEGPAEALALTVNTQPLMLIAGVATWRAWKEASGADPDFFAGHSLGEYTALVASDAIHFHDALPLVRFRAETMQAAVPEGQGGIAAILGLEVEAIVEVCQAAAEGDVLEPANLNSPGQIVIAGDRAAVERGMALAKSRGAKRAVMLPMSVPSHCGLMKSAAGQLEQYLASVDVRAPRKPVIQNAEVTAFVNPAEIKSALVKQLYSPVRWIETIQHFAKANVTTVVECVPGKVLTGLNKRIVAELDCLAVTDSQSLRDAVEKTRS